MMISAGVVTALPQISTLAHGQGVVYTNCSDRASVLGHLNGSYGETPVAMGLASSGGVVEILSSPDGSTWSIIITMPNGLSCSIAVGESWQEIVPEPGDES